MGKETNKSIKRITKMGSIFICLLLVVMYTAGCSKKTNEPVSDNDKKDNVEATNQEKKTAEETEAANVTNESNDTAKETENIINNGGMYVGYRGNIYYRQYTAESYEKEGLFGTYNSVPGTKKNMICKKPDGTTETAFEDTGEGDIFICNDRMYLMKTDAETGSGILYAVGLDGSKAQDIGKGMIKAIDEKASILVGLLEDGDLNYQLGSIDGKTGEIKKYDLKVPCAEFLALGDGVIYYRGTVDSNDTSLGKVKLCSVKTDGTEEKLLAETKADLYEGGMDETQIPCMQIVNDTIYFSYGAYAGTGHFYQGGKIMQVEKDGSGLAEVVSKDKNANDIFYVADQGGKKVLYYGETGQNIENMAMDLATGKAEKTDLPIQKEGEPFEHKGTVSVYLNAASEMTNWIPKVDYSILGLDKKADSYTVKDIELCDNWVYYRIEASESAPEASIGWRDGYRRIKSMVLRQELGKEQPSDPVYTAQLFTY